jgi:hypothetical protein
MYDESLPFTGAGAGVVVGGHLLGLPWIASAAAGLIIAGAAIYRLAIRGRRNASARG